MITTPKEYMDNLIRIQNSNGVDPTFRMPKNETLYKVDLNKRTIQNLNIVTVAADHRAETIYFVVDRHFDDVDLTSTTCIVQYINAKGEGAIYPVPFYDVESQEGKIIFPWCISGTATAAPGNIQFSIKFFKVQDGKLIFNLNTQPQTYKISYGMDITEEIVEGDASATILQEFTQRMNELSTEVNEKATY